MIEYPDGRREVVTRRRYEQILFERPKPQNDEEPVTYRPPPKGRTSRQPARVSGQESLL
jgi:hypothetical protein